MLSQLYIFYLLIKCCFFRLDRCIGGGLSVGTITEIYGSSISGKTQIALHFAANAAINHSQRVGFFSTSDLNASRLHDIMCCINRKMQSDVGAIVD